MYRVSTTTPDTASSSITRPPARTYAADYRVGAECLPRDQEQSRRLHEPTHMKSSIDPISGNDIGDRAGHPNIDHGNLTVYFESDATCMLYLFTPNNHPYPLLPGDDSADNDRGG